jgi:hypothetical protein
MLLKKEVIFKEDLESILGKRPDGMPAAPIKEIKESTAALH